MVGLHFPLVSQALRRIIRNSKCFAFKKVDERLLTLLKKKEELTKSKTIIITHDQLANELGTARVVVSRLLKQLEENGIVQLGRNNITLM